MLGDNDAMATIAVKNLKSARKFYEGALGFNVAHTEPYDPPGLTRKGDLHVAGTHKSAWLKDPDGNILALISE
jgi:hypothetical protein